MESQSTPSQSTPPQLNQSYLYALQKIANRGNANQQQARQAERVIQHLTQNPNPNPNPNPYNRGGKRRTKHRNTKSRKRRATKSRKHRR